MEDFLNTPKVRKQCAAAKAIGLIEGLILLGRLSPGHLQQAVAIVAEYAEADREIDAQLAQRMAA